MDAQIVANMNVSVVVVQMSLSRMKVTAAMEYQKVLNVQSVEMKGDFKE